MTPAEVARASRAAQGLPEHVEDPAVLARLAVLLVEREGGDRAAS